MNKWAGMGRITKDLDLKYSQSNMAVLKFSVAINRRKKDEVDFINCIAFDKTAENINKYFEKGSQIGIVGHIQTGSYTNNEGKKVYTTDIIVDEWDFCGVGKKQEAEPQSDADDSGYYPESDSDEEPF